MRCPSIAKLFAPLLLTASLLPLATSAPQLTSPEELFGTQEPAHPEFTLAHLEAMVAEFDAFVPHFELYAYPIQVSILEDDSVNASAGIAVVEGDEGTYYQAIVQVHSGFLEAVNHDPRMVRAVLAHEMAHLALGHAAEWADTTDLEHMLTRQEELAADAAGVRYLAQLGHPAKDMVDLLLFLDGDMPKDQASWLKIVASDHASPITRAALIDGDDTVLSALSHMEVGLAFMECRRYEEAIAWFEAALALEPRMQEAQVNIGLASLQDYYERLPIVIREDWLHPEFMPHLTHTHLLGGRSLLVTDKDRERFERALAHIESIPEGLYGRSKSFLMGTAQVLCPTDDEATLEAGVELLRANLLLFPSIMPAGVQADHLRRVNNMAVGLSRLGRPAEAQTTILTEAARVADVFLGYTAENVGRLPHAGLDTTQARQALQMALLYVQNTPPSAPQFEVVRSAMQNLLDSQNLEITGELITAPTYLCKAVTMSFGEDELELFSPVDDSLAVLGEPSDAGFLLEKYQDLACVIWGEYDIVMLTERGRIMKLTSYREGTSIQLRSSNTTMRETFELRIGMSVAELDAVIDPEGDGTYMTYTTLFGRGTSLGELLPEMWRYYPTLNLGVYVEGDVVQGLSVTPIKG